MKKVIYTAVSFLQATTVGMVILLEYLSKKKAGVNHHLIARKHQLMDKIYSDFNLMLILCVMLLGLAVFALKSGKLKRKNLDSLEVIKLAIVSIVFGLSISIESVKALNCYVYLLSGTIFIYVLQLPLVFKNFRLN